MLSKKRARPSRSEGPEPKPKQSFGIILFNDATCEKVCLVQRKDSFGYLVCICHNHELANGTRDITETLATITKDEKNKLLTYSWDQLWQDCCPNHTNKRECEARFEWLGIRDTVRTLDRRGEKWQPENQWGVPKGRMATSDNETALRCALREVKEEAGIDGINILAKLGTLSEETIGTDGKHYNSAYYIGIQQEQEKVDTTSNNEIRKVEWCTLAQCQERLPASTYRIVSEAAHLAIAAR